MNQKLDAAQQALIDQAREQEAIWRTKFLGPPGSHWRPRRRPRNGASEPDAGARRPCSGKPWLRKEVRAAGKAALAFGRVGYFVLSLMFRGGAKSLTHLYKYARACAYFWGPVKRLSLQPPQEKTEKTRGGQACGARHAHGGGPARAGARTREEGPGHGRRERRGDPCGEEDAT